MYRLLTRDLWSQVEINVLFFFTVLFNNFMTFHHSVMSHI